MFVPLATPYSTVHRLQVKCLQNISALQVKNLPAANIINYVQYWHVLVTQVESERKTKED
jgi:hypothetical protein